MLYPTSGGTNIFHSYNYNSSVTGNTIAMRIYNNDLFIKSASTSCIFANSKYGKYSVNLSGLTNNSMYTYTLSYSNSASTTVVIETGMLSYDKLTYSATTPSLSAYTRTVNNVKFYTRQ
jgi:hypothetical protein